MASNDTDITICSDALVLLGAQPITSLTDGSDPADVCNRLYPDLKNHLLTVYPWSWSLKKVQLSKNATAPVNEWDNAFDLPNDIIGSVIAVFDSSSSGIRPRRYGWEIYGTQLFTNLDTIYIDYQATVIEASMPEYFIRFLRVALAAEIAIPITDQATKSDYFRAQAYGSPSESGRGGLLREAMNIDGRGQGTQIVEDYSLIQARY
jgi:hypothetical protein